MLTSTLTFLHVFVIHLRGRTNQTDRWRSMVVCNVA